MRKTSKRDILYSSSLTRVFQERALKTTSNRDRRKARPKTARFTWARLAETSLSPRWLRYAKYPKSPRTTRAVDLLAFIAGSSKSWTTPPWRL